MRTHGVPVLPRGVVHAVGAGGGYLEDPWVAAGVGAVVVALVVAGALLARRLRRSPRRWPRRTTLAGTGVVAVVGLVVTALLAVNSYAGYLPTLGALGTLLAGSQIVTAAGTVQLPGQPNAVPVVAAGHGAGDDVVVALKAGSARLHVRTRPLYIYLPPGYFDPANATRRYATIYLIHGYPGGPADWLNAGRLERTADLLLADHLIAPMIMVMPDADGGWLRDSECLDAVRGPQAERYLTGTVVALVDRTFRTIRSPRARAIGGLSSGGFCALNLLLRHQNVFSVALAHEAYGTPGHAALVNVLRGDPARYRANSPSTYLPHLRFRHHLAVFLDAGTADPGALRSVRALAAELAARGQYVALRLARGQRHTWREVQTELPYSLIFATRHLVTTVPTLTTARIGACLPPAPTSPASLTTRC